MQTELNTSPETFKCKISNKIYLSEYAHEINCKYHFCKKSSAWQFNEIKGNVEEGFFK